MKDRVREAVFNLVGPAVQGKLVLDLFAGTGAMALEAISRGAAAATAVERRFPSAALIRQNAASLGVEAAVQVVAADVFKWWAKVQLSGCPPWLVFCCPPYAIFVERELEIVSLIDQLIRRAPPGSIVVVESDARFDTSRLPARGQWDVRRYAPAVISFHGPSGGDQNDSS